MTLTFDTHGNEKQKECVRHWVDNSVNDIVYGGSKGSAKSFTGCSLIFGDALMYPETQYFIARKKLTDLKRFTKPSISEVFKLWGLKPEMYLDWNGQDSYYQLPNGSKVFLLQAPYLPSDPDYERFGSMQMTRGWLEEAGEFEEAAKNNLHASVGRCNNDKYNINGKILQTCNPSKNYLYREYYKPHRDKILDDHKRFIQALPSDNKMLQKGYIENLHKILSKNQKERLLFGNWEFDDDPARLIEYDAIVNSFTNSFLEPETDEEKRKVQKYISCDVARFGQDKTVIMVWSGNIIEKIYVIDKSDLVYVKDEIEKARKVHNVPMSNVVIDEDGLGGGVKDMLRGSHGFRNNSKAVGKENFDNLKSQCYFKMSEIMNRNEMWIKDHIYKDRIIEELEQVKQKFDVDAQGKKGVVPKDKVKELLGRSPDFSDAIAMKMIYHIRKQARYLG